MIVKFEKYNESIKSLLVGPTKEEVWENVYKDRLKRFINYLPETPEEFFNKMKDGCDEYNNTDGTYFKKNGVNLFLKSPDNENLYISYRYIWSVLCDVYGISYTKIHLLIMKELDGTDLERFVPTHNDRKLIINTYL